MTAQAAAGTGAADPAGTSRHACEVRDVPDSRHRLVLLRADLDEQSVAQVRPALMDALATGRDVLLDMRAAGVVDSAGLGLLVRAHRAARQRGAALRLVAPTRFVITVLHTMHLDGLFPIYPDERAALQDAAPGSTAR